MTGRPVLCWITVHLRFAEDANTLYNSIQVCFITRLSKNAHYWWLKRGNFTSGFLALLTWLLLGSQTVRQYNRWACNPSDALGWKCVSSVPMEDELFMLVYSVSS